MFGFVFSLLFQVVPKTRIFHLCPWGFCLSDNSYGCVPLFEDSEARKNNLTLDQPHDKVKSGIPREKESKVDCAAGLFSNGDKWELGSTDLLNYLVSILSQLGWAGTRGKVDKILFSPNTAFAKKQNLSADT